MQVFKPGFKPVDVRNAHDVGQGGADHQDPRAIGVIRIERYAVEGKVGRVLPEIADRFQQLEHSCLDLSHGSYLILALNAIARTNEYDKSPILPFSRVV